MRASDLRIDPDRLLADLDSLGQIGQTDAGGVSRPALSENDIKGREWFRARVESAGLSVSEDGAGNVFALLPCDNPDAHTILIGSHLDTVPNGGRYDGALGVLSGLEVLRTLKDAKRQLPHHVEVVSFTDEEGQVFGMLGSRALAGLLAEGDPESAKDAAALRDGMARLGLTADSILGARRAVETIRAYLEVHIEQGTRLEESGTQIGLVTGIVGIRTVHLRFTGQAAHAGTMPMHQRRDALWAASRFILDAKTLVMAEFSPGVMNCGQISIPDGAANIVPADVNLILEFRHGSDTLLDEMQAQLLALAQETAAAANVELSIQTLSPITPVTLDSDLLDAGERAAQSLGLSATRLLSFAGHDAQSVARGGVPSLMLFVPSVDGISHNPRETTHPDDVINGANMLLQLVADLSRS